MTTPDRDPLDWKKAAEACLTTALDRAEELARDSTDIKHLESLIKTVSETVGGGIVLKGKRSAVRTGKDDDDDDD